MLARLCIGQRSPIFCRERSTRRYFSCFVCMRTPEESDVALSCLAFMEMDDSAGAAAATRTADLTASLLPRYASTPMRDSRAPQNLLPVGELERTLRHRLGEPAIMLRQLQRAFRQEAFSWQ